VPNASNELSKAQFVVFGYLLKDTLIGVESSDVGDSS
jgi:hypothetical protein